MYETLKPEGRVKYKNGKLEITIKVETVRDLKVQVNSWIQLYETLKGVEEVSK